jgi:GNAT superfamily N-acetyltransferase
MDIIQNEAKCSGIKFFVKNEKNEEIGRAFLYLMHNDLHKEPFGFLEDVFINENERGSGIGTKLVKSIIEKARELGCYKLIATSRHSRPKVHALYERLGFKNHGIEFRIEF